MIGNFKNINGNESFEELLSRHERMQKDFFQRAISPVLKADKGADLDDFIGMIAMIVSKALKKYNAVFVSNVSHMSSKTMSSCENSVLNTKGT